MLWCLFMLVSSFTFWHRIYETNFILFLLFIIRNKNVVYQPFSLKAYQYTSLSILGRNSTRWSKAVESILHLPSSRLFSFLFSPHCSTTGQSPAPSFSKLLFFSATFNQSSRYEFKSSRHALLGVIFCMKLECRARIRHIWRTYPHSWTNIREIWYNADPGPVKFLPNKIEFGS